MRGSERNWPSKKELEKLYYGGLLMREISQKIGFSTTSICKKFRELGIKAIPERKSRPGKLSNLWKGGMIVRKGYKMILSKDHPLRNSYGYVFEHRLVVEEKLGRFLTRIEVVHHIDENKMNNSLDNLVVLSDHEHKSYHAKRQGGYRERVAA